MILENEGAENELKGRAQADWGSNEKKNRGINGSRVEI